MLVDWYRCNVDLTADPVGLLEHGHVVSAPGRRHGVFEARRASPDHHDSLGFGCRLDQLLVFVTQLRVNDTV